MKVIIHDDPVTREVEINFSLVSITEKNDFTGLEPTFGLFMQLNEQTYNCCSPLSSFKDRETAWATLEPMIKKLLNKCYQQ